MIEPIDEFFKLDSARAKYQFFWWLLDGMNEMKIVSIYEYYLLQLHEKFDFSGRRLPHKETGKNLHSQPIYPEAFHSLT